MDMKLPFIMAFLTLLIPSLVIAHSGRTDSKGCHTNRKPIDYFGQKLTTWKIRGGAL